MAGPTIQEILEDFPVIFTESMNESLALEITENDLASAIHLISKGKASGHDGIPIEFFQLLWTTIGPEFHWMLCKCFDEGKLPQ